MQTTSRSFSVVRQTALLTRLGCVLGFALAFSQAAPGATDTWNGGGVGAAWTTGSNWGGTAPVANDALEVGS